MDAPTADNDVVLASLGGKPRIPGMNYDMNDGTESPDSGESGLNGAHQEDALSVAEKARSYEGLRQRDGVQKTV